MSIQSSMYDKNNGKHVKAGRSTSLFLENDDEQAKDSCEDHLRRGDAYSPEEMGLDFKEGTGKCPRVRLNLPLWVV